MKGFRENALRTNERTDERGLNSRFLRINIRRTKNTYFQVFQGFPALNETVAHIQPNGHFDQFLAKTVKIIKKALGTFFSHLQALTNCKVSEKSNERFPRKSVTYERTHVRTNTTPKVSNDFVERPKISKFTMYRYYLD